LQAEAEGTAAAVAPSRGRLLPAHRRSPGVVEGAGGVDLFFCEPIRGGARGGAGDTMLRKPEREGSELWAGTRAKAEYLMVLDNRFHT
jgi:hypothetical protein